MAVEFVLNGRERAVETAPPTLTLLEFLRGEGLCGTKEGCAEGDCGACTVALRKPVGDRVATRAVNACIMPLAMAHGKEVVTVEALCGDHPIQTAMVAHHAAQCGFCTPGFVMSLWAREAGAPTDRQALEDRLAGNLCRCTGYGPILEAAAASAKAADEMPAEGATLAQLKAIGPLDHRTGAKRVIAPRTEAGFACAVADHPEARIIAGATDVGLWMTKSLYECDTAIFIGDVDELATISRDGEALTVGAGATHEAFAAAVRPLSPALGELLRRFGGLQVRSAGTVGGNIANGSPIGDLPPALIAAGATVTLAQRDGRRTLPLEDFFIAYGRQDRRPGEYLRHVTVPLAGLAALSCHKVSKRFDSDITAVLAALSLNLEGGLIAAARVAFGGMAATPKRAPTVEAAVIGKPLTEAAAAAGAALPNDFAPIDDMRASGAYRMQVAKNLFVRDMAERAGAGGTRLAGAAWAA
ncbi:MAG: xanthine dehydrogenase small subunit [Pseudomonadota bacterium]